MYIRKGEMMRWAKMRKRITQKTQISSFLYEEVFS
jgi:hypothetical protein